MIDRNRSWSKEQFAAKGEALYDECVRPHLRPEDDGKLVGIDVDTGEFEIGSDTVDIMLRMDARRPEAKLWLRRIGSNGAVYRFGCRTGELP